MAGNRDIDKAISGLEGLFDEKGENIVREWFEKSGTGGEREIRFDEKHLLRGMFYAIAAQGELDSYLSPAFPEMNALTAAGVKRLLDHLRTDYQSNGMTDAKASFERGLLLMGEYATRRDFSLFLAEKAEELYGITVTGKPEPRARELFGLHQQIDKDLKGAFAEVAQQGLLVDDVYMAALCAIYERRERELGELLDTCNGTGEDLERARRSLHYLQMLSERIYREPEAFSLDDNSEPTKGTCDLLDFLEKKAARMRVLDERIHTLSESKVTFLEDTLQRLIKKENYEAAAKVRDRIRELREEFPEVGEPILHHT